MVRVRVSDKLAAAFYILLDKGPLSISSLAEEVSKLVGSKVTTVRAQLTVSLPELIKYGLVEEVGTDRFGSRLIDVSSKFVFICLAMYTSGLEYRYLPWNSLINYFERKHPELTTYVKLLMCVTEAWKLKEFGPSTEEAFSDFLEDLAFILQSLGKRFKVKDMKEEIQDLILEALKFCIRVNCENQMLECVKKEGLTNIFKELLQEINLRNKKILTIASQL